MAVPLRAVFFDIGETLVDETEVWGTWADWLGVPRLTLFAALGAVVAGDGNLRQVFEMVCPGRDLREVIRAREAEGPPLGFSVSDLYPDARPCLEAVAARGYRVGIAANQPARAQRTMEESGLPFEWLVISDVVGVSKPSPRFFAHLCELSGLPPEQIAYVGDRADNDVGPAAAAGMVAVHVRRGPWGVIHAGHPELARAALKLESLAELPARLDGLAGPVSG
jgi:FMN phosphatase YigB (HAD superfamily)